MEPSAQFLGKAAQSYFVDQGMAQLSAIKIEQEITKGISWRPTLWFKAAGYTTVAVEISPEAPYPKALKINTSSILYAEIPITVYAACPEEVFVKAQKEVKELRSHGFGLLTVDAMGVVTKQFGGQPLIQHIPEADFKRETKGLPPSIIRELRDAFELYKNRPTAGIAQVGEIVEAATNCAKKAVIRRGWATEEDMGDSLAKHLNRMLNLTQLDNAKAGIGRMRSYVAEYRNPAHHAPKSQKAAYSRLHECKHGFLEGIKSLQSFTAQLKKSYNINIRV
ncbi:MAG: hypothetical protein KAT62_00695 [Desulfuromonadales bacterium]|nr:hypothetical protein [Desulfuromonadales bacterium]